MATLSSKEITEPEDVFVGDKNAPLTLKFYVDYENLECFNTNEVVKAVFENNKELLRLNIRHFPLTNKHQKAMKAAEAAGVLLVTGDTKVVDRGKADGCFITTTGLGLVTHGRTISADRARPGDVVILSGPIAEHGMAIMAARARDTEGVKRTVARMQALFGAAASYQYAEIYAQALNADRAFAELDQAVRIRDPGIQNLKSDPFLDPIRREARYGALLARLYFPVWS